jgi:hypothetical protein
VPEEKNLVLELGGSEKEIDHEKILYVDCLCRVSVDAAERGSERYIDFAKWNPHFWGLGPENARYDYFQELTWRRASLQRFAGAERRTHIEVPVQL